MNVSIRHAPSFAVARCQLAGGEKMRTESGAMMATSVGVDVEAKMAGGLMKGLKRSVLGGESLFMSKYTAPSQGGWVEVAATLPGDAFTVEVAGEYILTRGAYLASSTTLEIDTKWGGFGNLAGGEGGFLVHITGNGTLVAACYGAIDRRQLAAGETITVDSGHLVAYSTGVTMASRKAGKSLMGSFKSGENLVFDLSGPGEVITQSRNPRDLESWIISVVPTQSA